MVAPLPDGSAYSGEFRTTITREGTTLPPGNTLSAVGRIPAQSFARRATTRAWKTCLQLFHLRLEQGQAQRVLFAGQLLQSHLLVLTITQMGSGHHLHRIPWGQLGRDPHEIGVILSEVHLVTQRLLQVLKP